MSRRTDRRSDAGIDDLLGFDDGPAAVEEEQARPVSRVGWLVRNALVVGGATAGTVGALRLAGAELPVLLVLAGFVALRWLMIVLDDVAPPAVPRAHRRGAEGPGSGEWAVDGLREAVRRWEARLDRVQDGGAGGSSNLLATFAELADERLRLRHGITRASDPQRAGELLGEPLWQLLAAPDRRPPRARDLAIHVQTLEDL